MDGIRCRVRIRPALLSSGSVGAFKGSGGGRRGQDDPWNDVGELGMSGEDGPQPLKRPPRRLPSVYSSDGETQPVFSGLRSSLG